MLSVGNSTIQLFLPNFLDLFCQVLILFCFIILQSLMKNHMPCNNFLLSFCFFLIYDIFDSFPVVTLKPMTRCGRSRLFMLPIFGILLCAGSGLVCIGSGSLYEHNVFVSMLKATCLLPRVCENYWFHLYFNFHMCNYNVHWRILCYNVWIVCLITVESQGFFIHFKVL